MAATEALIVGAGPAGVATAWSLARAGREVVVLDGACFPRDKPCGEGLLPSGVAVLRRLELLDSVLETGCRQLEGVAYTHLADGEGVFAPFPPPPGGGSAWGLGVRRLHFDHAMASRLRRHPSITLLEGRRALRLLRTADGSITGALTEDGPLEARITVGADGLRSDLRRSAGWTSRRTGGARYGIAGHWRINTRDIRGITITFGDGHEWYQAPVGPDELLVSALGNKVRMRTIVNDYAHQAAAALPILRGAEMSSPPRAAGLLDQRPTCIASDGLFLVGDAAGSQDPTTGEGIGVALQLGETLGGILAALLTDGLSRAEAEREYVHAHSRLWRDRRRLTALALLMASHPSLSRRSVRRLRRSPEVLSTLLGINCGYWRFDRLSVRDWLAIAGL